MNSITHQYKTMVLATTSSHSKNSFLAEYFQNIRRRISLVLKIIFELYLKTGI